ncbi:MAG: 2Fe-2S iron-sulfur cluster binding domain-containing protein [Bacteroidia bacterium]|nr:2Fe-2S iron-sulfur cluster binding domain-containing protein [Sphingobacteriaceae bacterium]MBK7818474.1 2Fe-2S iron-sulfur cluster binding domain-containing protein [Sphingobacteriaceae bacterium]MBP9069421.1 2Fe-2S iron-sulfur cluster binding domain-containing protein [Bacteroidia bacterium]
MARFHTLKVKDIKRETAEAVSVAFEIPAQQQPEYLFKQGQYITLKMTIGGNEVRRSYSLCTAPHEKELRVAIKEVKDGLVSSHINQKLKVGETIEVMTPMGTFTSILAGNQKKKYVLFAGGSGITPMMSILKSILYVEKQSTITLIYANKNEDSTIFKNELDSITASNPNLKVVYVFDAPKNSVPDIQKGIITSEKALQLIENYGGVNADDYFICGPGPMMENVKTTLEKLKIKKEKIHIEYFTSVIDAVNKASGDGSGADVKAKVTVIQYGTETTYDLETSGISILDASIEAGVDAPYSCKGAVCCTCRAKVIEGKVKMDANFALTDDEVAQGFILTCQSHPLTEKVIVDYDAL